MAKQMVDKLMLSLRLRSPKSAFRERVELELEKWIVLSLYS